jgi:hypothetical protein
VVGAQFSPGSGDTAPIQRVRADGPRPEPTANYLLKGAGLVAIAVVSGLLWWLIRHDTPAPVVGASPSPAQAFTFKMVEGPKVSTNCEENAHGEVKKFFAETPCKRLSRALYETTSGKAKAVVSVVLVGMPDSDKSTALKKLADGDSTGNVNDLLYDHTAKIAGAPDIGNGEYESRLNGTEVTIVLVEFLNKYKDDALRLRIATEAIKLSSALRS